MSKFKVVIFILSIGLFQACAVKTDRMDTSEQTRAYVSSFYQEFMPLTESDLSFRRTKFHGQTDEIYLAINRDNENIVLRDTVGKSIVMQAYEMLKSNPSMPYSKFKESIEFRTIAIDEEQYRKFKKAITKIEMAILIDRAKKREGDYRVEVVADGESYEYSLSNYDGYTISTHNNSDSKVVEAFMQLRDLMLLEVAETN